MPQPGKKAMSGPTLMVVITVMVVITFVVMIRLPRRRKSHDHRMPAERHCIITSQAVTPVPHNSRRQAERIASRVSSATRSALMAAAAAAPLAAAFTT